MRYVPENEWERIAKEEKLRPKNNPGRRKEIVQIGCELKCLTVEDIRFILNDDNEMGDVERRFFSRKTA